MRSCALGCRWKMYLAFVLVRNPAFILALKLPPLIVHWIIFILKLSPDWLDFWKFIRASPTRVLRINCSFQFSLNIQRNICLYVYKHCLYVYEGFDVLSAGKTAMIYACDKNKKYIGWKACWTSRRRKLRICKYAHSQWSNSIIILFLLIV